MIQLLPKILLRVPEHGCLLEVLGPDGLPQLAAGLDGPELQGLELRGEGAPGQPGPAGRLVHQVDGLVREKALGQIAAGQVHRRLQGLIGDGEVVVPLVSAPKALEDGQGLVTGGLPDRDGLEAALQGGVLLDIALILVQCGGPQHLELPTGQSGLQDVGGVDGPLRAPAPTMAVQLHR